MTGETAVIVGAGPGLGAALARRFANAGMNIALASRKLFRLEPLAQELIALGVRSRAYACDATVEKQVEELFLRVQSDLGTPDLVVYNAGAFVPKGLIETSAEEFERCWRVGCYGGFLAGRDPPQIELRLLQHGAVFHDLLFRRNYESICIISFCRSLLAAHCARKKPAIKNV